MVPSHAGTASNRVQRRCLDTVSYGIRGALRELACPFYRPNPYIPYLPEIGEEAPWTAPISGGGPPSSGFLNARRRLWPAVVCVTRITAWSGTLSRWFCPWSSPQFLPAWGGWFSKGSWQTGLRARTVFRCRRMLRRGQESVQPCEGPNLSGPPYDAVLLGVIGHAQMR